MSKKILIVEDEPELRSLIKLELETSGYTVVCAEDGEAGLRMASEERPDLVISDVLMPKIDGNQMLQELRALDFGKNIPVIILTARRKMKEYFEIMDVSAFLEKPFEAEELLDCVEKVFRNS